MTIEGNKKTIRMYYEALQSQDWKLFESTIHDDFYQSGHEHNLKVNLDYTKTGFYNFIKLLGFDEDTLSYNFNSYTNKKEWIELNKWVSTIFINWDFDRMVAEDDKVWVYRSVVLNDPHTLGLELNAYVEFWMRDEKVIANLGAGLYLQTLLEYGSLVMKRNREEEIMLYLESLHQWGLIPKVSSIKT
ncbi:MAG: hypothetical protein HeimC2_31260 [Candidatus Heimdallarchaeota archaeon LC_2]|nr:MAG: hypothetical protein HeimC2_31260 [Candidatus Heimdallarchaeota archaeon LC_2]